MIDENFFTEEELSIVWIDLLYALTIEVLTSFFNLDSL
jgi:hypothetical protein